MTATYRINPILLFFLFFFVFFTLAVLPTDTDVDRLQLEDGIIESTSRISPKFAKPDTSIDQHSVVASDIASDLCTTDLELALGIEANLQFMRRSVLKVSSNLY